MKEKVMIFSGINEITGENTHGIGDLARRVNEFIKDKDITRVLQNAIGNQLFITIFYKIP